MRQRLIWGSLLSKACSRVLKLFIIGAEHRCSTVVVLPALTGCGSKNFIRRTLAQEKDILDLKVPIEFLGVLPEGFPFKDIGSNIRHNSFI